MASSTTKQILALAAATALAATALAAAPALGKRCDEWVSGSNQSLIVQAGQVVCAEDSPTVIGGVARGGRFVGGAAFAQVQGWVYGRVDGHRGPVSVWSLAKGGIVVGGPGNDEVLGLAGGHFIGGPGDDIVLSFVSGKFIGGPGDDEVLAGGQKGGHFVGGAGNDQVRGMTGGTFIGGGGADEAQVCGPDVTVRSVEIMTLC